jgi:hypothetical protein
MGEIQKGRKTRGFRGLSLILKEFFLKAII